VGFLPNAGRTAGRIACLAVVLAACEVCVAAGGAGGLVTIAEGKPVGIRALAKIQIAEGVRVQADDLLQTGKDGFLRVELEDGTTIDLGPNTSIEFSAPAQRRADRPALYMLSGWIKLQMAPSGAVRGALASAGFDLSEVSGSIVARIEPGLGAVFVEQGGARWNDRRGRGAPAVTLKRNDFLAYRKDDAVAVAGRPGPEFIAALPRQFRDLLPQRYASFKGHEKPARAEGAFSYAEVEPWLNAEAPVRRQFVRTWRAKADDASFRASLDQAMAQHPEWDPVLHPELYEPKPRPEATATAVPASTAATAPAAATAADAATAATAVTAAAPAGAAPTEKK
jgi:hypothetical protein